VNVAAVALAAKHARIAWAILAHGADYRPAAPEVVAAAHRLPEVEMKEVRPNRIARA
jgi:poly-gamma-glutamate capsule biosynthesis protein CapA/YwtB (metallophosphatase superfamily)